jgi:hypothetical protein
MAMISAFTDTSLNDQHQIITQDPEGAEKSFASVPVKSAAC